MGFVLQTVYTLGSYQPPPERAIGHNKLFFRMCASAPFFFRSFLRLDSYTRRNALSRAEAELLTRRTIYRVAFGGANDRDRPGYTVVACTTPPLPNRNYNATAILFYSADTWSWSRRRRHRLTLSGECLFIWSSASHNSRRRHRSSFPNPLPFSPNSGLNSDNDMRFPPTTSPHPRTAPRDPFAYPPCQTSGKPSLPAFTRGPSCM